MAGAVTAATLAELGRVGALETTDGQLAVVLAAAMDDPGQSGAGLAALARELRETMVRVRAARPVAADPVDELAARRDHRRRGGVSGGAPS